MSVENNYDEPFSDESAWSESEPEIPELTISKAPSSKKRSLNNTFPTSSSHKRFRCRSSNIDQILSGMNEDGGEQFEAENSSPGMTSTPKGRSSIHGSKKGVPTNEKVTPSSRSGSSDHVRGSNSVVCPSTPENSQRGLTPELEHTNVSEALKEITSLLNTVVKRMDHMEDRLKQQLSTSTVSSSSATEADKRTKKKSSIPLIVRVSYHF